MDKIKKLRKRYSKSYSSGIHITLDKLKRETQQQKRGVGGKWSEM
jgi:hypothetical protein